jgi:hypothetical protein
MKIGDTFIWTSGRPRLGNVLVTVISEKLTKVSHGSVDISPLGRASVYELVKDPKGKYVNVRFQFDVKYRTGTVTKTETEVVPISALRPVESEQ